MATNQDKKEIKISEQLQNRIDHTVNKYCDRFFSRSGKLF